MRNKFNNKQPYIEFILIAIILALVPFLQRNGIIKSGDVTIIGTTLIYTIAGLGLNFLLGYAGLLSLGTAGFMGLAAYISAFLVEQNNWSFFFSLIVAVLVPTILGIIVGILSLKFEGIYLGIATLVVGEVLREIFLNFDSFTNGTSGALASFPEFFGKSLNRNQMYLFIVFMLFLSFLLFHNLSKGYLGRSLNAMRGSESSAQAMGINIFMNRLLAFGVSTFLASLSGVLYVHFVGIAYPSTWTLNLSLDILAIIVIGGLRSIKGTLVGAFVIYAVTEMFFKNIEILSTISPIVKGILIILVILYYPYGIAHLKYDVQAWWEKRKEKNK